MTAVATCSTAERRRIAAADVLAFQEGSQIELGRRHSQQRREFAG